MIWAYFAIAISVAVILALVVRQSIHSAADAIREDIHSLIANMESWRNTDGRAQREWRNGMGTTVEASSRNLEEVKEHLTTSHDELGQMFNDAIIPALAALLQQQQRANDIAERTTPRPEPVPYDQRPSARQPVAREEPKGDFVTWSDIRRANEMKRQRGEAEQQQREEQQAIEPGALARQQGPQEEAPQTDAPEPAQREGRRMFTDMDEILRNASVRDE